MKPFVWIVAITLIVGIIGYCWRSCNDATEVMHKEFDASALLKKYEYFKNLSAAIDEKRATLDVYREELREYKVESENDKVMFQQRKSEALGILSIHNQLCSEYNSAMSKFNYRFTNAGDLPASNLTPLPREYKPYILTLK